MLEVNDHIILTWGRPSLWREANQTLIYLVERHRNLLTRASFEAQSICDNQATLSDLMDEICLRTCPWCPEPCCAVARVWFDFRDLIFLHVSNLPVPNDQPLYEDEKTCRYLGVKGCRLPRNIRPWTCTRYLCPTQMNIIRKKDSPFQAALEQAVWVVKSERKRLEREFMQVILG